LNYCVFTRNGNKKISGVKVEKQMILINNIPFMVKQIFGSEESTGHEAAAGEVADDAKVEDCVICLDEKCDTIIMPCGHLTVCKGCGITLH
jgi:hypothetical protein